MQSYRSRRDCPALPAGIGVIVNRCFPGEIDVPAISNNRCLGCYNSDTAATTTCDLVLRCISVCRSSFTSYGYLEGITQETINKVLQEKGRGAWNPCARYCRKPIRVSPLTCRPSCAGWISAFLKRIDLQQGDQPYSQGMWSTHDMP
jgi:hypothetical protein